MDVFTAAMIVEGVIEVDTEQEYIDAAQSLIDSGAAWQLQGFFGRTCSNLIERGLCTAPPLPCGLFPDPPAKPTTH